MKWYANYNHPSGPNGPVMRMQDNAYVEINGITREIHKHYTRKGYVKFFTFVRRNLVNRKGFDRYVCYEKTLKRLLVALKKDTP